MRDLGSTSLILLYQRLIDIRRWRISCKPHKRIRDADYTWLVISQCYMPFYVQLLPRQNCAAIVSLSTHGKSKSFSCQHILCCLRHRRRINYDLRLSAFRMSTNLQVLECSWNWAVPQSGCSLCGDRCVKHHFGSDIDDASGFLGHILATGFCVQSAHYCDDAGISHVGYRPWTANALHH